jgi:hypothetical protein
MEVAKLGKRESGGGGWVKDEGEDLKPGGREIQMLFVRSG